MSDEKHNLQHKADRAKASSKRSVLTYMTILFLAAFVLLLLAYVMQQRTSVDAIDGLKDSVSAIQTAQEVYEENSALRTQIRELEDQLEQLEDQTEDQLTSQSTAHQKTVDQLTQEIAALKQQTLDLEYSTQALDWFWQINEAYVRGRYATAKTLIENLQASGLTEYLPKNSITDNGRFSPYDRYQEIYDALY